MPQVPEWKKTKAFRMRLEHKSMKEVAKECHMSSRTIQQLENGWTDKAGVRHPGWKEKIERIWAEREDEELKTGLALKRERIKVYKRLAQQGIDLLEKQFPNITMKNTTEYKALSSEVRELLRLLSVELGDFKQATKPSSSARKELTLDDLQDRFDRAQKVKVPDVEKAREAEYVDDDNEAAQGDGE